MVAEGCRRLHIPLRKGVLCSLHRRLPPRERLLEVEVVPRSIFAFSFLRVISLTLNSLQFPYRPHILAQNDRSPRRLLHGGPQRREVVVTLIPERDRSDPVYAVAQVAVDPGDVSWSGPFDQQTRYGMCRH
jgi:hypothetical protein